MSASPPSFLSDTLSPPADLRYAVFGKHPSGADHLSDLGLTTLSLMSFKQGFYTDGIISCVSRQTWIKNVPSGAAVPYDHSLLTIGKAGWIAARFTQSTDTSGRDQFPLVTAIHGGRLELLAGASSIWQWLEKSHAQMVAATDLRPLHAECQTDLAEQRTAWEKSPPVSSEMRTAWAEDVVFTPSHEGLWRVTHALLPSGAGGSRARLPLQSSGDKPQNVALWASWLRHLMPDRTLTMIWPSVASHCDLTFNTPDAVALTPIFALPETQPLTSTVPFSISPALVSEAESKLKEWLSVTPFFSAAPAKTDGLASKLRSWLGR